jgi:hypothetical protein
MLEDKRLGVRESTMYVLSMSKRMGNVPTHPILGVGRVQPEYISKI